MLLFLMLGPMEIHTDSRTSRPRGTMLPTLLAALLSSGDKLVSTEALIEELWGATPPNKVDNALQAHISRARRMLGRVERGGGECRLTTVGAGYRLNVDWTELDAASFQRTLDLVRRRLAIDEDELEQTVAELRSALTLWRGPVFGGLAGGPICQAAVTRYEETRTTMQELLYDYELRLGGHARIIPELTELLTQNPLQEHLCSLLMVALYRSGRQVEALEVFRQFRRRLDEEFGMMPSPVLRRYEEAILSHDPVLARPERLVRETVRTPA
jgi:DNA-binding SARP family transcriptional activator